MKNKLQDFPEMDPYCILIGFSFLEISIEQYKLVEIQLNSKGIFGILRL